MPKSKTFVCLYDTHWPTTNLKVLAAIFSFMDQNRVDGVVFGGDQFDNQCISPHVKGRPGLVDQGSFARDTASFDEKVLRPLEKRLPRDAKKIWVHGNHDHWQDQYVEERPELRGVLQREETLQLKKRGWKFIPCGQSYQYGKLTFIHGETLRGGVNHARQAVENYCTSVLYGHFHSPQSYTKILPHYKSEKWVAYCSPIVGETNPHYLRNNPTSWLQGFTIVEFRDRGFFNVFPCVMFGGQFSYGGKVYGAK